MTSPIDLISPSDDGESENLFKGFTFDAEKFMWICDRCDSFVAGPVNHNQWHKDLDARMTG
jgi:hypothetical protein